MAITKSGSIWRGDDLADLAEYLRAFQPGGYPVSQTAEPICYECGARAFRVQVDDDEGCAKRTCVSCDADAFIADSAEVWDDADPGACGCPCGGSTFSVAIGFALRDNGDVRWISVGLRCITDGRLGVYTDWKIDYNPTDHLFTQV